MEFPKFSYLTHFLKKRAVPYLESRLSSERPIELNNGHFISIYKTFKRNNCLTHRDNILSSLFKMNF